VNIYGTIKQLVAVWFKQNSQDVKLTPNSGTTYTAARTVQLPAGDADAVLVARASTDTLTNKTISGASNTLTVRLANDVSGTLPVANGGTGVTSSTGSGANVLGTSPALSAPGISDQALFPEPTAPSTPSSGKLGFYEKAYN
jgi:hypothetical protein